MSAPVRVAMWSGPRNISTAMMRAWGSRPDTFVTDEPLYAHYLAVTGLDHPAREEILETYESDWEKVVEWLLGPVPEGKPIWFQKHMTLHLTPEVGRDWLGALSHCFLVRHPREVITSYVKVRPEPTVLDLGYRQQSELFEEVAELTGEEPPVVDARRVLEDPRGVLERLCERLGVAFDEAMLAWEPGIRETDGIWAPHWYSRVAESSGFSPYRPKGEDVPGHLSGAYEECLARYEELLERAL